MKTLRIASTALCLALIAIGQAYAAASILQETGASQTTSVTTYSKAFTANVTAGSVIEAFGAESGNVTVTCSDNNGNTYAAIDTVYDSVSNYTWADCYAKNVKAGATTVTVTFSSPTSYPAIVIREIGGVSTLDGHAAAAGTAKGQTSLSVSPSNANQPALISSLASANAGSAFPSFTAGGTNAASYGSNIETGTANISATGSQTVSGSFSGANTVPVILSAIFDAGGPVPNHTGMFFGSLLRTPATDRRGTTPASAPGSSRAGVPAGKASLVVGSRLAPAAG